MILKNVNFAIKKRRKSIRKSDASIWSGKNYGVYL